MLKKTFVALLALFAFSFVVTAYTSDGTSVSPKKSTVVDSSEISVAVNPLVALYDSLQLGARRLNREAYLFALKGHAKLKKDGKLRNADLLTIVDFSQASTSKRMYIIDLKESRLVEQSLVAHGRNTGELMAKNFSNQAESFQSSLGFYVTSETYQGKHGLSLRLDGMEKQINDNARNRAIVIHGAVYATESFCKSTGYLGRSYGCPAVPQNISKSIINTIRNGSCLFIYSPNRQYLNKSSLLA